MPYYATSKEAAENGLQFWNDEKPDLKTHTAISALNRPVYIPIPGDIKTIADIPSDHQLIQDSQDITLILDTLGLAADSYGCLFVKMDQTGTEYESVYACESNVPYVWKLVDKIL